jgi:uncharacterized protein YrzB (UPF0473 family)
LKEEPRAGRAWYAGRTSPDEEMLAKIEEADSSTKVLYDHASKEGEYAEIVKALYNHMDSLKRSPTEFRTWTEEDGMETFLQVLLDFSTPDMRSRVAALQRLGAFRFRSMDGPEEKKAKIAAIFADSGQEEDYQSLLRFQAKKLASIWSPTENTLLNYIVLQPAQMGRVLADRLNPANQAPFKLIGHPFAEVRSTVLQPLAHAKAVAYERSGEIHLVTDVRKVLEGWDQDAAATGGCAQVTLLDALLLHEMVELVLHETQPEMEPLDAHMVASTFERYLKSTLLSVAVEDFFLSWPQPSAEEMNERMKAEMEQQLSEITTFLGEDDLPQVIDEEVADLPVDKTVVPVKKKAKASKKGKLVRTKDGKLVRIMEDGTRVVVKKKNSAKK